MKCAYEQKRKKNKTKPIDPRLFAAAMSAIRRNFEKEKEEEKC